MAQIVCKNLTLGYEGRTVLKDLDFEVNAGDYLCIVGENGSGKSTLMKTVLGLVPPVSGEVVYGDGLSKTKIGYLPQQTVVQKDFPASVSEIVLSGCLSSNKGLFYTAKSREKAAFNMERIGISHLAKRCYRELSGGQQQRVLLARALCATDKMLLLDEPAAGLDPKVTDELYAIIKSLNDDGITVIMISHDIPSVVKYASHILHVGHDVFFGKRDEYLEKNGGLFNV